MLLSKLLKNVEVQNEYQDVEIKGLNFERLSVLSYGIALSSFSM